MAETSPMTKWIVGIVVITMVIAVFLIPIISAASQGPVKTEQDRDHTWMNMKLMSNNADFSVDYSIGDSVTVTNGTDVQSGSRTDMIIYADNKSSVIIDGTDTVLVYQDGSATLGTEFNISKRYGEIIVTDGTDTYNLGGGRSWMYVPHSQGTYANFTEGDLVTESPHAISGSFAGLVAYNGMNNLNIGLTMNTSGEGNHIENTVWEKTESETQGEVTLIPDTSTVYTDGYWNYKLYDGKATITRFTGAGSTNIDLVIPATVSDGTNTYPVKAVGENRSDAIPIAVSSFPARSLIISEGIEIINQAAFSNLTQITGKLVIPEGVTYIGKSAFGYCLGFTGLSLPSTLKTIGDRAFQRCMGMGGPSLVIPDGVTYIGEYAFEYTNFDVLVIPESVTSMNGAYTFSNCGFKGLIVSSDAIPSSDAFNHDSNLKQVLNWGDAPYTTTSYGLNADEVRTSLEADCYIAPLTYTEMVAQKGTVYTLMSIVPILAILGLVSLIMIPIMRHRNE